MTQTAGTPDGSPATYPIPVLAGLLRRRELSATELVRACLDRIEQRNGRVNAFVTVCADRALEHARAADERLAAGEAVGPLHGIPVGIKDLDAVAGVRNTRGTVLFASDVPAASAPMVTRLEAAGAIVVGKTNTPEFGHKALTDNYLAGPTSTPFDLSRNAGGSSGGSAAAVGEGLVPLATGSDAGGSLRVPAAFCGAYTLMPSFGRVPARIRPDAYGPHSPMVSYGPIARSVGDAVAGLTAMSGHDPRDPYSLPPGPSLAAALGRPAAGLRVAYVPDLGGYPVEPEVDAVVREAVTALAADGADVEETKLELPASHQRLTAMWRDYVSVRQAEFVVLARDLGLDVLGRDRHLLPPSYLELAEGRLDLPAREYRLYDVLRTKLLDAVQDVFDHYDLIVSPTTGVAGVPNGSGGETLGPSRVCGQDVDPIVGWALTGIYNFVGAPAASVPAGTTASGLPVGMQIAGRRYSDHHVVTASAAVERRRPWHDTYVALERERTRTSRHDRPEGAPRCARC